MQRSEHVDQFPNALRVDLAAGGLHDAPDDRAGAQLLTAEDPLPEDLRDAFRAHQRARKGALI